MATTTDEADVTLDTLWHEGITSLTEQQSTPGTTYEVAPGIIGTMPWPTLADKEKVREIRQDLQSLFKEDASAEQFDALTEAAQGDGSIEAGDSPIKEGITSAEFTQTTASVNCRITAYLLDYEQEVEPSDIVPEMAAVVSAHFSRLVPGTNGQTTS